MGRPDVPEIDIPVNIPDFYKGKSVLLTGFTGTLGKLIAEKLLYSCPDLHKLYIIVRGKRGKSYQERVQETLQSLAFSRLREKYPGQWEHKIVALSGNMMDDKLGLSEEDRELLRREVNIVIHGAASIRFDDPLDVAIKQNTMGAKKMVDFALTMPNLISFVYISTAYTNCDHLYIKEELYPPRADWKDMGKISEHVDPAVFQTVYRKVINGLPNTYVFSKSLSEQVINEYRNQLPVVIVRPSIVVPGYKEPMPGWSDNKYGPMSLLLGFLFGIIRCSWVNVEEKCNYIHSDIIVNATIIAAWKRAYVNDAKSEDDTVTVYNVCEPPEMSITHRELADLYKIEGTMDEMRKDGIHFVMVMFFASKFWYRVNILYRHALPAFLIDRLLILLKNPPMLLFAKIKVFWATYALHHFTSRTFLFETTKFDKLTDVLKPEDRDVFGWVFKKDSFSKIFNPCYILNRQVLMKPIFDDLETNRKRLYMLYIIDRSVVFMVYGLILWIVYKYSVVQAVISSVISFFILPA